MTKKVIFALGCLALLATFTGAAMADQITLGPSDVNDVVQFKNVAGTTSMLFAGSASAGGTILTGMAAFPNNLGATGPYTFTYVGAARPTITSMGPFAYSFNMGATVLNLDVCITSCANQLLGSVTLNFLSTLDASSPQISGTVVVSSATGILFPDFAPGNGPATIAFDVNMTKVPVGKGVDWVYTHPGTQVYGALSSGEVVPSPIPEPGTLALMGTGILGLAGLIRRKKV